ncbi:MAG: hypothetical protein LBE12_17100 [Planctomycetaceae bacterium]|jgi:hypothetical protein|nr:hypothetical protein [Planctomycetaceae bacterium]
MKSLFVCFVFWVRLIGSMKGCFCKITQNKILRWVTSVAVLFYVLIPSIGTCHCSCCKHTNQVAKTEIPLVLEKSETTEKETKTCCCSEKKPVNKPKNDSATVSPIKELPLKDCCQSKGNMRESGTCPCLQAVDVSPFMLEVTVSVSPLSEELKSFSSYLFVSSVQPVDSLLVLLCKSLDESIFCLSVRLHLLLNVMLN